MSNIPESSATEYDQDEESKQSENPSHTEEDSDSEQECMNEEQGDDDDGGDSDEVGEVDRYWPPPIDESVECVASYSSKTVSALTFNNAGSRFAAGGHDYEVRIWDFQATYMGVNRPTSICNTQPCGQTVIQSLDFSNNDELVLVISGGCQAVILGKDGLVAKQYQCPKGDQYISDMANTKGHVQMLNDGCWNPKDRTNFITCSNDSTIRIWDLNDLSRQKTVIKTRSPVTGLKALPNVCKYSRDALSIITGCNDGTVMMWDTRRKFISTSACIKNAHLKGSEITGIDFSYGLNKICTRSEDESCKIWDTRQPRAPLATQTGLTTLYSTTDCSFSPDDKLIITGTSGTKSEPGHLHFLDADNLNIKSSIDTPDTSVVRSRWHPKINHIAYSCSNGSIFVTYDKRRSMGGFLVAPTRGTKRRSDMNLGQTNMGKIVDPHAQPLSKKAYKPELPVKAAAPGSTLSSYVAKKIALQQQPAAGKKEGK